MVYYYFKQMEYYYLKQMVYYYLKQMVGLFEKFLVLLLDNWYLLKLLLDMVGVLSNPFSILKLVNGGKTLLDTEGVLFSLNTKLIGLLIGSCSLGSKVSIEHSAGPLLSIFYIS